MRLVIALTTLLVAMSAASASSQAPQRAGLFAYDAERGGLFTIRPDGTMNTEIVPGSDDLTNPVIPMWSPDGSRLLYERQYTSLESVRPDGTEARQIVGPHWPVSADYPCNTKYGASDGTWAPSGRRIAFVGFSEDDQEHGVYEVCTVATDGSGMRRLRRGTAPDWFPGGHRLAFLTRSRVAVMRADGSRLRVVARARASYVSRYSPDVSPDGKRLAFFENRPNSLGVTRSVLRIVNLRTHRIRTIQPPRAEVSFAAWAPGGTRLAGKRIAFIERRGPEMTEGVLRVLDVETGRIRTIHLRNSELVSLWEVTWVPDAVRIVVVAETPDRSTSVASVRLDGTREKVLFTLDPEQGFASHLTWQPLTAHDEG